MHKLTFYVPESHLDIVKNALFSIGAGKLGLYDSCCWQTKGQGQYRPLEGSTPFLGEQQKVSQETEYMVEMVCEDDLIDDAINALIESHPYETPAFQAWPVRTK